MKKFIVLASFLLVLSACSPNNNQVGRNEQGQAPIQRPMQNVTNTQNNAGYNIQRMGATDEYGAGLGDLSTDEINADEMVPSEPDSHREEKVLKIVNESEKYLGQSMEDVQFINKVFKNAGFEHFDLSNPYRKIQDYSHNIQPGDVLSFDLDGDGHVDHHAIKLGNGDIIHVYKGKVQITDILIDPMWKEKMMYVQRVF